MGKSTTPAPQPKYVDYRDDDNGQQTGTISKDINNGHLEGVRDTGNNNWTNDPNFNPYDANFNGTFTAENGEVIGVVVHSVQMPTTASANIALTGEDFVANGSGKVDILSGAVSSTFSLDTDTVDVALTFSGVLTGVDLKNKTADVSGSGDISVSYETSEAGVATIHTYDIGYTIEKSGSLVEAGFDFNAELDGDELTIHYNTVTGEASFESTASQVSTSADGTVTIVLDDPDTEGVDATLTYNPNTGDISLTGVSGETHTFHLNGLLADPENLVQVVGI